MAHDGRATRGDELAGIRAQLEAERARLEAELVSLTGPGSNGRHDAPFPEHPTEHAGDMEEHERSLALQKNLRHMQEQVGEALGRMARGEYGRCRSCGAEIAIERLQALPHATRCVPCQEAGRG
ncbi:MAG TPA: TraR/DksA family transcriptional regulator [Candidatus Micrarchaeia archaeon]|nr:TraR/DksA family transcriptional regulator [Candidatus Micrarchaeia archaeon]